MAEQDFNNKSGTGGPPGPPPDNRPGAKVDREMEEFRGLMQPPSTFENGFTWPAFFGALFVAALMVPGVMYMGLLAGQSGSTMSAAQWVTVILFIEVARRANKFLKKAEIFTLFYLAGAAMGTPFAGVLWNQFYAQSAAAQAHGIMEHLPHWFAPTDPEVLSSRNFFRIEWLPAIGLVIFGTLMSRIDNMVLGYGLFRLANDVEKLPFPLAPVGAQGILALSEEQEEEATNKAVDEEGAAKKQHSWRWRVFSIGSVMGLVFGVVYLGLPTITGALLAQPIIIFPIPFTDFTPQTGSFLPAVATGLTFDLGHVLIGMVLPWFAMVGSFVGMLVTYTLNPILYHYHVLTAWTPGDGTIITNFKNYIDFYFSFGVGISLAIAGVGVVAVVKGLVGTQRKMRERKQRGEAMGVADGAPPPGRGDIQVRWIIATYLITTVLYIAVSMQLIGWHHHGVLAVMLFYGFVYTPLISYASARLEGIAGQTVTIPMVREAAFILSGYQGVAIWFLPVPLHNYGAMTVFYRKAELTGTSFWSVWKAEIILTPIVLFASLLFAQFIWSLGPIPGPQYPFAQVMWDLQAENNSVIYSATLGGYSLFERAFNPTILGIGFAIGLTAFNLMSWLGWPTFLVYGIVRGIGGVEPHSLILQFGGALLGRYYFQKKLGLVWRQYIPVVFAGFSCGMGLIATLGIGFTFLSKAVFKLPF